MTATFIQKIEMREEEYRLRAGMTSTRKLPGVVAFAKFAIADNEVVRKGSSADWIQYPYVNRTMIIPILLLKV